MTYRKKPIEVEAAQFLVQEGEECLPGVAYDGDGNPYVTTVHGQRARVAYGDWIVTEPDGIHHYPCKPDIFEATYEEVTT